MLPIVLILIAGIFIFLSVQGKLNFKFLCNLGLHATPDECDISCDDTKYKCRRCGKDLQL